MARAILGRKSTITPEVLAQIKDFYILGYPVREIAVLLDLHPQTLYRHLKLNPKIKEKMDELKNERFQGVIERGLSELAQGTKTEEVTEYWEEVNEQGEKVKKSKTTKTLAPNVKALQVLAQKYDKVFSKEQINQINNLLITTDNTVSMREILDYRNSKDNPLNKGDIEDVVYTDIPAEEEF